MTAFVINVEPFLKNFILLTAFFMVEYYVFLEKELKKKTQRIFYIISYGLCFILTPFFSITSFLFIFCGIHIMLSRKERKLRGFFLSIPIQGIVNGVFVPIFLLKIITKNENQTAAYSFGIEISCFLVFLFFILKGKKWRENFRQEMGDRHLLKREFSIAVISGCILLFFADSISSVIYVEDIAATDGFYELWYQENLQSRMQLGLISVLLTIMIITVVMQGNKQSYYQDKTRKMDLLAIEKEKSEIANQAKTNFLSTMSHEIRTPMNAIVGMTDILLRNEHTPQNREYLNNIKSSGDALLGIINDILDFSKIEAGKMEIVKECYEPAKILHDLSMIFLNRIGEKNIELLYDIDKNLPRQLYGDAQRIRQIILNLMNNAIKFTDSGFVKLSLEVKTIDQENIELLFRIKDSGIGIKQEDIGQLFGSFTQVDKIKNHHKEGSGLGLAICKQLVEMMEGSIGVESVYGEGSTFYFSIAQKVTDSKKAAELISDEAKKTVIGKKISNPYTEKELLKLAEDYKIRCVDIKNNENEKIDFLFTDEWDNLSEDEKKILNKNHGILCVLQNPMKENLSVEGARMITKPLYNLQFCWILNREEEIKEQEGSEYSFCAPKARILLVDDNEMNQKVAKGLLQPFLMQVDVAKNGKEAVEYVNQNSYDMVFMDHMMPVMDGIEATKEIRKSKKASLKELPIVALSANATQEAKEMFLKEGMNDFVAKPIKLSELSQCLYKWLPKDSILQNETGMCKDTTSSLEMASIEGIDISEGIRNSGSKELFFDLLGDFYKLISVKSKKVEDCLLKDDIKNYTIEVHALKSMARMVGAMELSEDFYHLEQLGNQGEKEELKKLTPDILKRYRNYQNVLKDYVKKEEENKKTASSRQIEEILTRLHDFMDNFDMDAVDGEMKELNTLLVPEDLKEWVENLEVAVTDVDMEGVLSLTDEMIKLLKENEIREKMSGKKPTIMLVDDDEINAKAVKTMLKDEFAVICVSSGKSALETLKTKNCDLILLDVYMPEMDGHEVIRALKKNDATKEIPVVFLTSDADENTEIKGFGEGAVDFFRKPFRKDVAVQRIRRILQLSYLQKNLEMEVEKQTEVAKNRQKSMQRLSWQMVQALVNAIDAKDSYTNGHSMRVAHYTVCLAKKMGYGDEKLRHIQYAALLHDIGKIGIPREIINKTSKLTDEEYAVIKQHPVIGEKILKEVTEIPDIASGARWHHERYDGHGYPDGLLGEEIPEQARIIGVADAYDAMTSKRSYRDILTQEKVMEELKKGMGTQFDPRIAELMLELVLEDKDYTMHE